MACTYHNQDPLGDVVVLEAAGGWEGAQTWARRLLPPLGSSALEAGEAGAVSPASGTQ